MIHYPIKQGANVELWAVHVFDMESAKIYESSVLRHPAAGKIRWCPSIVGFVLLLCPPSTHASTASARMRPHLTRAPLTLDPRIATPFPRVPRWQDPVIIGSTIKSTKLKSRKNQIISSSVRKFKYLTKKSTTIRHEEYNH
jgi:hypothetical protein